MPVTRHPPHRSRRALLTRRAPTSGSNAETLIRIWVQGTWMRQPFFDYPCVGAAPPALDLREDPTGGLGSRSERDRIGNNTEQEFRGNNAKFQPQNTPDKLFIFMFFFSIHQIHVDKPTSCCTIVTNT